MGDWDVVSQVPAAAAPPPAAAADPWAVVAHVPAAPPDTRSAIDRAAGWLQGKIQQGAAPAPGDPTHHNFFESFHDEAVAPVLGMLNDAIDRGDYGKHVATELLNGFYDQLKTFAAHPDIRNLPLVGPGATATAARMQEQYNAGNYKGMFGTLAGFAGPIMAPEAAAGILEKLPAAARVAAEAADVTGQAAKAAQKAAAPYVEAAGAGVRAAAPDVAKGLAKTAGSAAVGYLAPAPEFYHALSTVASIAAGERVGGGLAQIGRGLRSGVQAAGESLAADRAAATAAEAKAISKARVPLWQQAAEEAAARDAATAEAAPAAEEPAAAAPEAAAAATSPMWDQARADARERAAPPAWEPGPPGTPGTWEPYRPPPPPAWEPGPPGTPAPPARPGTWEPYQAPATGDISRDSDVTAAPAPAGGAGLDTAEDARETLSPEEAARAEELRTETHAPGPALTAAQKIEDAITRHVAYLRMQAQDLEMANRARKADTIAGFVLKHDLPQTPEMYGRVADALGYDKPPSADETVPMIEDRLDWHKARAAAGAPAPEAAPAPISARPAAEVAAMPASEASAAPTNLEQQLQASIDAIKSKRGQETGARELPEPAPERAATLDTGTTRGRKQTGTPAEPLARPAAGDSTEILIPGQRDTYPAQYAVKELADIQPSHNGQTFEPNPNYGLKNDRNYDDPRNQRKIVDWSTKESFNPRNLLNTAPDASIGPPITDAEGNVLGGNGRTMILQRVYASQEGGQSYRAELDRTAHHYGIDPADYAHMKQPVLVRVANDIEAPEDLQRAVTRFNYTGTAALTPAERAIADARGVSQQTLDDIAARMDRLGPDATLAQAVEGRSGLEILRNFERDGVITPQESAGLATETKLTRQGKERVSGLMLGRFFNDAKQMDTLPDSLRNKLERMAAPLARAESAAGYSLQPTIKGALDLLEEADAHGAATLDDFLRQRGMFQEREYSPEAIAFAKAIKSTNPVELTHAARRYAERARYAQEYQGPGMFNDIPAPLPPREAFLDSFEHLAK